MGLVDLGIENYKLSNEIQKINGQDKLSYWENEYANEIRGTDGQQMHPFLERSENISSYCTDIYRSIWLPYTKDRYIHGVQTFNYMLPPEVFALPSEFPPNQGFCTKNICPPGSGVISIATAEPMNAPVFVSQPHFLHADDLYRNAVTGLTKANKTEH